jgi:hypothetical protein
MAAINAGCAATWRHNKQSPDAITIVNSTPAPVAPAECDYQRVTFSAQKRYPYCSLETVICRTTPSR